MSIRTAADQESVVLCKRKDAASVWPGRDFQVDLHSIVGAALRGRPSCIAEQAGRCSLKTKGGHGMPPLQSMCNRQIVKRHFMAVAGIEACTATPEVFGIGNSRQILAVDIKRQLRSLDSYLQSVWRATGMDGAGLCLCYY